MFYSHDTYGLGHLRRTLALASFFRSRRPLSQLIVTGSPLAHRFPLPNGVDYIKLPSVVKVAAGRYASRSLGLPFRAIRDLRRDLVLASARHYQPQLLVVDNVPGGLKGELLPSLHLLKAVGCRLVLGLRDVIDEPDWVRKTWASDGSYDLLERVYDRILVYGDRELFDPIAAYGFPPAAAAKTCFVGYLALERGQTGGGEVRRLLQVARKKLILVMAGGGEDGYELLRAVLAALQLLRDRDRYECLLVGGPLMPPGHRREILELTRRSSVRYHDFLDDVAGHIQAADLVISMGGYNSVCELLSLRKLALVVPRVSPRREQLIRAQLLSERGFLHMLDPAELEPRRLRDEMSRLLEEVPQPPIMPMTGLDGAADVVDELLRELGEPEGVLVAAGGANG